MNEKKRRMKFRGRTQSKNGIWSLCLSVISIIGFISLCVVSTIWQGNAPMLVGSIALLLTVFCITAFWLAVNALKEKEVYYGVPIAGLILSGTQFVIFLCLYMMGIF